MAPEHFVVARAYQAVAIAIGDDGKAVQERVFAVMGLSVAVGDEMFIVPLTYIVESLQPAAAEIKTVSGRGRVVHVRGEYLPLVALHEVFNIRPRITEVHRGIIVILEAENRKVAMFVDALVGQHQVVIKSLESNFRRVNCVSGATIMGDGRVALILDVPALLQSMIEGKREHVAGGQRAAQRDDVLHAGGVGDDVDAGDVGSHGVLGHLGRGGNKEKGEGRKEKVEKAFHGSGVMLNKVKHPSGVMLDSSLRSE